MNCWTRCFPKSIRPDLLLAFVLLAGSIAPQAVSAQRRDYFTELEINDIKLAQEIADRTAVLLWVADRRLVELSPAAPEGEAAEDEGGLGATIGNAIIRVLNPEGAAQLEELERERAALEDDLAGHTRTDLLRGYLQALEETMDNIDDAYERDRGEVREPIEALRDFSEDALEALEDLESTSDAEARALDDAIEETETVIEGSAKALETISN